MTIIHELKAINEHLNQICILFQKIPFDSLLSAEPKSKQQPDDKIKRQKHKKSNGIYSCKYCSYQAKKTSTISMHCRKHHSDKPEWKNLKKTIYECKHCDETFSYKMNYLDHIHKKHQKIKKQCPFCPKMIAMNGVYAHCYKKHATPLQKKETNLSEYKFGKMLYERKCQEIQSTKVVEAII